MKIISYALDTEDICKGTKILNNTKHKVFKRMIRKIQTNIQYFRVNEHPHTCLKPCQELKAHSSLINSGHMGKWNMSKKHSLYLQLSPQVKVKKHHEAYDVFDLVVEVGSSLGLWIGLSALGVFDLLLKAGAIAKTVLAKYKS